MEEWDLILPQLMRAFRGTPHSTTGETANMLMLGRELRLPDQMQDPQQPDGQPTHEYARELVERLRTLHQLLQEQQLKLRTDDTEEPLLYAPGDLVLMLNRRRRKGENPKLQPKFVGPYTIKECYSNHTYKIESRGQCSVQNESRLKLYQPCIEPSGQAPGSTEPAQRPT